MARLRAEAEALARTMTVEGGSRCWRNRDELEWTAAAFDYYAEIGRDHAGRVIPPIESTQLAMVVKDLLGRGRLHRPLELPALAPSLEASPSWRRQSPPGPRANFIA